MMEEFRLFMETSRPVVSFDFDGVLHTSLVPGTTHPIDYFDWWDWTPNTAMIAKMRDEARHSRIVIVTARDGELIRPVWEFIHEHDLPVDDVYHTGNGPKWPVLNKIGAVRHYDDSPGVASELRDKPIEFVKV